MHLIGKSEDARDFKEHLIAGSIVPGALFVSKFTFLDNGAPSPVTVLYINDETLELFGAKSVEELMTSKVYEENTATVHEKFRELIVSDKYKDRDFAGSKEHLTFHLKTINGKRFLFDLLIRFDQYPGDDAIYINGFAVDFLSHFLCSTRDSITNLPILPNFIEYCSKYISTLNHNFAKLEDVKLICFGISNFNLVRFKYGVQETRFVLKKISELICNEFSDNAVSRFQEERFITLTSVTNNIEEILVRMNLKLVNLVDVFNVKLKAVVYRFSELNSSIEGALKEIDQTSSVLYDNTKDELCFYTKTHEVQDEINQYVIEHIDEAIRNNWIKVYYQPVMRSISKSLCSCEALARWIDPNKGFLNPGQFISALENSHQISKLDAYIVEEICKNFQKYKAQGKEFVPVSFNLSRLDFMECDIFQIIEDIVKRYEIPRRLLKVEITETMIMSDSAFMKESMAKFHDAGYQIWMDDFGSGYSSLNVLKDFDFDELKIDMIFLSKFNDRAKDIILSVVKMAKLLGIQTLAEGVETEDQYEFLKEIGCEKIQGYYFGKPMTIDDLETTVARQNWSCEDFYTQAYCDNIGSLDFTANESLAVIEYCDDYFKVIFSNKNFEEFLKKIGIVRKIILERMLNSSITPLSNKFRDFIKSVDFDSTDKSMLINLRQSQVRVFANLVSKSKTRKAFKIVIDDLALDKSNNIIGNFDSKTLDVALDSIFVLYDDVVFFDLKKRTSVAIFESESKGYRKDFSSTESFYDLFLAGTTIDQRDKQRYLDFINPETIFDRIKASQNNYIECAFRFIKKDGSFVWKMCTILGISDSKQHIVVCVKTITILDENTKAIISSAVYSDYEDKLLENTLLSANLWGSLLQNSPIKFFWKDKDRRFLGVNRSFLNYYGIESEDQIIGKTDEDMHWHIDDNPFMNDELEVISDGKFVYNATGKCIIKGVVHNIIATKMPIYKDGQIVGLVGYFEDAEDIQACYEIKQNLSFRDPITGIMNARSAIATLADYAENRNTNGVEFANILIDIHNFNLITDIYGVDVGYGVLRHVAEIINKRIGNIGCVARLSSGMFLVFYKYANIQDVETLESAIVDDLRKVQIIKNIRCSLIIRSSVSYSNSAENALDMLTLLIEKLDKQTVLDNGNIDFTKDRVSLSLSQFEDMDSFVVISDPVNYSMLYLNKAGRRFAGIDDDTSLKGLKCFHLLRGQSEPCPDCNNNDLTTDCFLHKIFVDNDKKELVDNYATLIPLNGSLRRFQITKRNSESFDLFSSKNLFADEKIEQLIDIELENKIKETIQEALLENDEEAAIGLVLSNLCSLSKSRRTTIFKEHSDGSSHLLYECKNDDNQYISFINAEDNITLYTYFKDRVVWMQNIETHIELPVRIFSHMKKHEIQNFAAIMLYVDGVRWGIMGVENSNYGYLQRVVEMLKSLMPVVISILRSKIRLEEKNMNNKKIPLNGNQELGCI